mgnify:CR=1 FL=1
MIVGVVMGSDSDYPIMKEAVDIFTEFGIEYELRIISAHRTPCEAIRYASKARERGLGAIVAGAGLAAHLAGFLASHTTLPIIGVPIGSGPLQGKDALYSTVQMPPGIPVATMGINGARNAALFACQILALQCKDLQEKLADYRAAMAKKIGEKDKEIGKGL